MNNKMVVRDLSSALRVCANDFVIVQTSFGGWPGLRGVYELVGGPLFAGFAKGGFW
jgi:hypothetical protein